MNDRTRPEMEEPHTEILGRQILKDLTGWLDLVQSKHPGPWFHLVNEGAKLVAIRDRYAKVIATLPVCDATMLLAHLSPETLRELLRGYMLYRSSMTALPIRYLAMAESNRLATAANV